MEGVIGLGLAILGSLCLNVGKGVQKWKVRVLGAGWAMVGPDHRRDFAIWLTGLVLTASTTLWYSMALKYTDKPSLVSATSGVGLIGLFVFARLVLGETVTVVKALGALAIIAGTALFGLYDEPLAAAQTVDLGGFGVAFGGLAALFIPLVLFSMRTKKLHGFTFGALAGSLIGLAMVLGDMALAVAGDSFAGQFSNPYPYVAVVVGFSALGVTQVAFWRSTALVVVPTTNSMIILTPMAMESLTFGTLLAPLQYMGVAAIVLGVVLITVGGQDEPPPDRSSSADIS